MDHDDELGGHQENKTNVFELGRMYQTQRSTGMLMSVIPRG